MTAASEQAITREDLAAGLAWAREEYKRVNWQDEHFEKVSKIVRCFDNLDQAQKITVMSILHDVATVLESSGKTQNPIAQLGWAAQAETTAKQLIDQVAVASYLAGFAQARYARYEHTVIKF